MGRASLRLSMAVIREPMGRLARRRHDEVGIRRIGNASDVDENVALHTDGCVKRGDVRRNDMNESAA